MNKQDEYLKRLIKEGDTEKVITHLVAELKRLRAMVRTMKEDQHISQQQWSIRKRERVKIFLTFPCLVNTICKKDLTFGYSYYILYYVNERSKIQ